MMKLKRTHLFCNSNNVLMYYAEGRNGNAMQLKFSTKNVAIRIVLTHYAHSVEKQGEYELLVY